MSVSYSRHPAEVDIQVDNLHPKALDLITSHLPPSSPQLSPKPRVLELHGTLARVHCMQHRHEQSRDDYQDQIARANPVWDEEAKEAERTGNRPRTNPDGDVRRAWSIQLKGAYVS